MLDEIPDEISLTILKFLSPEQLRVIACTNKYLNALSVDDSLYREPLSKLEQELVGAKKIAYDIFGVQSDNIYQYYQQLSKFLEQFKSNDDRIDKSKELLKRINYSESTFGREFFPHETKLTALRDLSRAYFLNARFKNAKKILNELISIQVANFPNKQEQEHLYHDILRRALTYFYLKDYKNCIDDLTYLIEVCDKSLFKSNNLHELLEFRGDCYAHIGSSTEAITDYKIALNKFRLVQKSSFDLNNKKVKEIESKLAVQMRKKIDVYAHQRNHLPQQHLSANQSFFARTFTPRKQYKNEIAQAELVSFQTKL